jgi:hypothetical protein
LADEPCDYERKKDGEVGAAYEDCSAEEPDHADRLIRSAADANPVTL